MDSILIIYHYQGGIVEKMTYALKNGIEKTNNFQIEIKNAQDASWDDLKKAKGFAVGTADYFDYMAGTVKDFFDRTFYPSQSKIIGSLTTDLPCVFFASGGTGGQPAIDSLIQIGKYFKFNVVDYLSVGSKLTPEILKKCEDLGEKLAAKVLITQEESN